MNGREVDGTVAGRCACIIGAGLGGLALAIRLQAGGIATTVIEARDRPGGLAAFEEREGFIFDSGPTSFADPLGLEELWRISGHDMARDVELLALAPMYRLAWPDGTTFDYACDPDRLIAEIARFNPIDVAGYDRFADYARRALAQLQASAVQATRPGFGAFTRSAAALVRQRAWRSLHALASRHFENGHLRQAFSFRPLMTGGNPLTIGAASAASHRLELAGGLWCARGGTNRLVTGMVRHFERLGGTLRLHDPVIRIETIGTRACGVETRSGWKQHFDVVASNADLMHSYRDLLGHTRRGGDVARRLARKRFSPSQFVVRFGLKGIWPGIAHNTVLLGARYEGFLEDLFVHGVLPQDFPIFLRHPSVTDPSLAPPGQSSFEAVVPVAHMGKLALDWEQAGPLLERRIFDELERRLIPDIRARIVTVSHLSPRDFALEFNTYLGSAFSLEQVPLQSGGLRAQYRDDEIENLYFVGAGTRSGAGVSHVINGARLAGAIILKDLAMEHQT